MKQYKISFSIITIAIIFSSVTTLYSQMKFNAGMLYCNIDGDTISFDLKTDLNDLYYMAMGGTAEVGIIKIQWAGVKTPSEVKVQTLKLEKGFIEDEATKISVIWADFYTNMPWIIKSGQLSVTSNDGSTMTGTLEITVELAGSPMIGDLLKGKSQTVLTHGYFEIKY